MRTRLYASSSDWKAAEGFGLLISFSLLFVSLPVKSLPAARPANPAPGADSAGVASGEHASLWTSAVATFGKNRNLVPGKVIQRLEEVDEEGHIKSRTDIEMSFALDAKGEVKGEIISARKDGKDITAQEKKKIAEREKEKAEKEQKETVKRKISAKEESQEIQEEESTRSRSFSFEDSPLSPERQNVVQISQLEGRENIGDASCVCFEFRYSEKAKSRSKGKATLVFGKAWIDEASGRAVKIEFTTDPLPKHVRSMRTTIFYGFDADSSWVLKQMTFEARGGLLIFEKRIRGDIRFSDYWQYEELQNGTRASFDEGKVY